MIFLRSLLFNIAFYLNLFVLMVSGLPFLFSGRQFPMEQARRWGRSSFWLMRVILGIKVEFRGVDNLPKGGCIVAAKHQSIFETFALLTQCPDFTYAVKKELLILPFFGWYLKATEQISVDRGRGSSALTQLLRATRKAFADGRQLLIFPEGTRRPVGAPPAYKFGVVQVYALSDVPCVPVGLNAGLFWPRRSFLRRPGNLVVEFLPPIAPGLEKTIFQALLQEQIESCSNRLVAEAISKNPELADMLPGA